MSLFVSTGFGIIKEVDPLSGKWKNLAVTRSMKSNSDKEKDGISCMCWKDTDNESILYATASRHLRQLAGDVMSELVHYSSEEKKARPVSVCALGDGAVAVGVDDGMVHISADSTLQASWRTGAHLSLVRNGGPDRPVLLTGGRENDVKLWDPQRAADSNPAPVFAAKNVRPDELCLRRPVWVTDGRFLPDGKMVVVTGHGDVRVYDPSSPQRRPVLESRWGEAPISCLAVRPGRDEQLFVGSSEARLAGLDLRRRGAVTGSFRGLSGGLVALECCPEDAEPVLYSLAADRFLRVHHLDSRQLVREAYLKLRPTDLLVHPTARALPRAAPEDVWDALESVPDVRRKRKAPE